jgi:hypothetical protein
VLVVGQKFASRRVVGIHEVAWVKALHTCGDASNNMPLGYPRLLPFHTVNNSVATLKAWWSNADTMHYFGLAEAGEDRGTATLSKAMAHALNFTPSAPQ